MHRKPTSRIFIATMITLFVVVIGGVVASAYAFTGDVSASGGAQPGSLAPTASPAPPPGFAGGFQDPVVPGTPAAASGIVATRIEIPAIGVDTRLELLSVNQATGVLEDPEDWRFGGWYQDGTLPGETGPAIIAGHVDSTYGPAVFARLDELVAGNEIRVTLSDASVVTFLVDSATAAPKASFPSAAVYGPTPTAQLRLITCDGTWDKAVSTYPDNLIVFASIAS